MSPTSTSYPIKPPARLSFFIDPDQYEESCLGDQWTCLGGQWSVQAGIALQTAPHPGRLSEARLGLPFPYFTLKLKLRALEAERRAPGAYGFLLDGEQGELFSLEFLPRSGETGTATGMVSTGFAEGRREKPLDLPWDFQAGSLHLARLEVSDSLARLSLDSRPCWQSKVEGLPVRLVLFTRGAAAAFSALELTLG